MKLSSSVGFRPVPLSESLGRCGSVLSLGIALAMASGQMQAADRTWSGGSSGATGRWDLTVPNWSGGAWMNGDLAIFGVSSFPSLDIGTGGVSATGLVFNATGYRVGGPGVLTLSGPATVTVGSGFQAALDARVAGSAGMTVSGGGTLVLTGVNSLTGTLSVGASTTLAFEDLRSVSTATSISLAGGTLRYSGTGEGSRGGLLNVPLTLTNAGGRVEASGTGSLAVRQNVSVTGAGNRTLTLGGSYADGADGRNLVGNLFEGSIGDNVSGSTRLGATSLVKEGDSTWILRGNNWYSGSTEIRGGRLVVGDLTSGVGDPTTFGTPAEAGNLGSTDDQAQNLVLNGGALRIFLGTSYRDSEMKRNFTLAAAGGQIEAGYGIPDSIRFSSTAAVAVPGSVDRTLVLNAANPGLSGFSPHFFFPILNNPSVSGKTSLVKTGNGVWVSTPGAAHGYTGLTAVRGGGLEFDASGISTGTRVLSNGGALELSGGALAFSNATGAIVQNFAGLTLGGGRSRLVGDSNGSYEISLGGITRNPGGTLEFSGPGASGSFVVKTTTTNSNGILGGYAILERLDQDGNQTQDWASVSGTGVIQAPVYTSVSYGDGMANAPAGNYRIKALGTGGDVTLGAAVTNLNTLVQATGLGGGANDSAYVDFAGKKLRLGTLGGVMNTTQALGLVLGRDGASRGVLTAGGPNDNTAGEINLANFSTAIELRVNALVENNGTGAVTLLKSGPGLLIMGNATNTYSGGTFLNEGMVRLAGGQSLGTGLVTVGANGSRTRGGLVVIHTADAVLGLASTDSTARIIPNNFRLNGGLQLGDNVGTGRLTLSGQIDLAGGTRAVSVFSANGYMTLSGAVVDGSGGRGALAKDGAGVLVLTGANSYSGGTYLRGGSLDVAAGALGTGLLFVDNLDPATASKQTVTLSSFQGSPVRVNNRVVFSGALSDLNLSRAGLGAGLELAGGIDFGGGDGADGLNPGRILNVAGTQHWVSGTIDNGGFRKVGAGELILTGVNTFAAGLDVVEGSVRVAGNGTLGTGEVGVLASTANVRVLLALENPGNLGASQPLTLSGTSSAVLGIGRGFQEGTGATVGFSGSATGGLGGVGVISGGNAVLALDGIRFAQNVTNTAGNFDLWLGATNRNGVFSGATLSSAKLVGQLGGAQGLGALGTGGTYRLGGGGGTLIVENENVLNGGAVNGLLVGSLDNTQRALGGTVVIPKTQAFGGAVRVGRDGRLVVGTNGALGTGTGDIQLAGGELNLRTTGAFGEVDDQYRNRNIRMTEDSILSVDSLGGANQAVVTLGKLTVVTPNGGGNRTLTANSFVASNSATAQLELRFTGNVGLEGSNPGTAGTLVVGGGWGGNSSFLRFSGVVEQNRLPGSSGDKSLIVSAANNVTGLILGNDNTYTGSTRVNRGVLVLGNKGAAGVAGSEVILSAAGNGIGSVLELRSDDAPGAQFDFGTLTLAGDTVGTREIRVGRYTTAGIAGTNTQINALRFEPLQAGSAARANSVTVVGQRGHTLSVAGQTTLRPDSTRSTFSIGSRGTVVTLGAVDRLTEPGAGFSSVTRVGNKDKLFMTSDAQFEVLKTLALGMAVTSSDTVDGTVIEAINLIEKSVTLSNNLDLTLANLGPGTATFTDFAEMKNGVMNLGALNLDKSSGGTLVLGGTGALDAVSVSGGSLVIRGNSSLGTSSAGVTVNSSASAALLMTGGGTLSRNLTVAAGSTGTQAIGGITSGGLVGGTGGGRTFSGTLTLGRGVTLLGAGDGDVIFSGAISESAAGQAVTVGATTGGVFGGVVGGPAPLAGVVRLTANNTFTGALTVNNGTLIGTAQTGTGGPFGSGSNLTLNGATVRLEGLDGSSSGSNNGILSYGGGNRIMVVDSATDSVSTRFAVGSLTRSGSGTLTLIPENIDFGVVTAQAPSGDARFTVASTPTATNGILSPSVVMTATGVGATDADFVANNVNSLVRATYSVTDVNTGTSTSVINSGAATLTAERSAYALRLNGTLNLGTNPFNLGSAAGVSPVPSIAGLILNGGAGITGTGALRLGTSEAAVYVAGTSAIPVNIEGRFPIPTQLSAFTKFGPGQLTLSGINTYRGATTVNEGELVLGSATALPIYTYSGAIVSTALSIGNAATVTLNGNSVELSGLTGDFGSVLNMGSSTVTVRNSANMVYSGRLAGTAGSTLRKLGTGSLTLDNTRTGTAGNSVDRIFVDQGTLRVYGTDGGNGAPVASQGSVTGTNIILRGGILEFFATGDNSGSLQRVVAGNNITVGNGNGQLIVERLTPSDSNKVLELGSLTLGQNQLYARNNGAGAFLPKFTGTTTLNGSAYIGNDIDLTLEGPIGDGGIGYSINKFNGASLLINSPSNSYSGGTVVHTGYLLFGTRGGDPVTQAGNTFVPSGEAKAGTGDIFLMQTGRVRLNDTTNLNPGQMVRVLGGSISGTPLFDIQTDKPLEQYNLSAIGSGALALGTGARGDSNRAPVGLYTQPLDLGRIGDGTWGLSATQDTVYMPSTLGAGAGNRYRFFGRSDAFLILNGENVLTGGNGLELGRPLAPVAVTQDNTFALVRLDQNQNYTGSTLIYRASNRGGSNTLLQVRGSLATSGIENYGRFELTGGGRLTEAQALNYTARPGSTLRLDYVDDLPGGFFAPTGAGAGNAGAFTNKWADTVAMRLDGSQLNMVNASNVQTLETIGGLSYGGGSEILLERRGNNAQPVVLINGALTRIGLGTLAFRTNVNNELGAAGLPGTANAQRVILANPGANAALNRGLVNGTTVNMVSPQFFNLGQMTFIDYDPAAGLGFSNAAFRSVNNATFNSGGLSNGTEIVLQSPTGVNSVIAGADVWALRSDVSISDAENDSIRIRSGGLAASNTGGSPTISVPLIFGSAAAPVEASIWTNTGNQSLILSGALTAQNLTRNGPGRLILSGANPNLTGIAQVNGGVLDVRGGGAVSALSEIRLHGAYLNNDGTHIMPRLELRNDSAASFAPRITLAEGLPYAEIAVDRAATAGTDVTMTVAGLTVEGGGAAGTALLFQNGNDYNLTVQGPAVFGLPGRTAPIGLNIQNNNGTNQITLARQVSGPALLSKNGNGPIRFLNMSNTAGTPSFGMGANSLSGGLTVNEGELQFATLGTVSAAGVTNSANSPVISGLASTANLFPGMQVTGTNVPANAYILSVDSATQVTLSAAPTLAITAPTFASIQNLRLAATNTASSSVLTLPSTAGLYAGMSVANIPGGSGIPGATTIRSVDSPTQITLSAAATVANVNALFLGLASAPMSGTGPVVINRGVLRTLSDTSFFNPLSSSSLTFAGPSILALNRAGTTANNLTHTLGGDTSVLSFINNSFVRIQNDGGVAVNGIWNGSTRLEARSLLRSDVGLFQLGNGLGGDVIHGTGFLDKTGFGTLVLNSNAANTFSGGLNVYQGLVRAGTVNDTFGTGAVRVFPGGAISVNPSFPNALAAGGLSSFAYNSSALAILGIRNGAVGTGIDSITKVNQILGSTAFGPTGQGGVLAGDNSTGGMFNWLNGSDLSTLGNGYWFVGALTSNTDIGGTTAILPGAADPGTSSRVYRFGGGGANVYFNPGSTATVLTDVTGGTPAISRLLVGKPNAYFGTGAVYFNGNVNNTYTGGTTVSRVRDVDGNFTVAQLGIQGGYANSPLGTGAVAVYGNLSFENNGSATSNSPVNGSTNRNAYTFHPGSRLIFENNVAYVNPTGNTNARWADGVGITLRSSGVEIVGSNANNTYNSETVGALSFEGGSEIRSSKRGAFWSELVIGGNLTRVGNGTLTLVHDSANLGVAGVANANRVRVTGTAPAMSNGMVSPFMISRSDNQFLKYDATNGFQVVTQTSSPANYVARADTTPLSGALSANLTNGTGILSYDSGSGVVLGANLDLWALRTQGDISAANPDGAFSRIGIRSGGLTIYGGTARTISADLFFGNMTAVPPTPVEALVHASSQNLTLNGQFTASAFTKFGTSSVTLNQDQLSFTGPWNLNQGQLIVQTPGGLGQGGANNAVFLNGWTGNTGQTFTELRLNFNPGTPEELVFTSGKITALDQNLIRVTSTADRVSRISALDLRSTTAAAAELAIPGNLWFIVDGARSRLNTGAITLFSDYNLHVDAGSYDQAGVTTGVRPDSISNQGLYNLSKTGDGRLYLGNNPGLTGSRRFTISEGSVRVEHSGALGDASMTTVVENGGALAVGVAGFQQAGTLQMQPGSIERWSVRGARATNYNLPAGVHLQIEADQTQTATYGLNGGSIMGYVPVDIDTALVVNTVGPNVSFTLLSDSSLGQPYPAGIQQYYGVGTHKFYDMGKANFAASPANPVMQGGYLKVMGNITGTGSQTLTKIGQDVVQLAGNNTGFNVAVREGLLQLGSSTALPSTGSLTMRGNGVLDLSGNNATVSSLNGDSAAAQILNSTVGRNTLSVQSGTYDGSLKGNINLVKQGAGTLRLNSSDTSFNGTTSVTGGTLQVANSLSATTAVSVTGAGARLEFVGAAGNSDRINNFAAVVLGAGGRLVTNGFSEGSSAPGQGAGMGMLTLQSGAEIDFGNGALGSTLLFEGLTFADGTSVIISNWTGKAQTDDGATGNDRLLFRTAPGFSESFLRNVQFQKDDGTNYALGATMVGYNGYVELVPVPEPSTWLLSGLGGMLLGLRNRRRVSELLAQWRG